MDIIINLKKMTSFIPAFDPLCPKGQVPLEERIVYGRMESNKILGRGVPFTWKKLDAKASFFKARQRIFSEIGSKIN